MQGGAPERDRGRESREEGLMVGNVQGETGNPPYPQHKKWYSSGGLHKSTNHKHQMLLNHFLVDVTLLHASHFPL